jgi:hypothetical protein
MNPHTLARISALMRRRPASDRREAKRLPPGQHTICLIWFGEDLEPANAVVSNLSHKGAGLLAEREYASGSVLRLLLVNGPHTFALATELKVVRCFQVPTGEYFLGGPFLKTISHDELVPFMT